MIFKQEYIDLIFLGKKTQTRRPNRGYYKQGHTYALQPCRTCKGIEGYRIVMDKIWFEKGGISHEDAFAEGGYVPAEFEWLFFKIYPKCGSGRWAFKFHVVSVKEND
jgi:hypothetical protein